MEHLRNIFKMQGDRIGRIIATPVEVQRLS